MSNQNGKGSKPRPTNKKEYDQNYDSINWGKKVNEKNNSVKLENEFLIHCLEDSLKTFQKPNS